MLDYLVTSLSEVWDSNQVLEV